MQITIEIAGIRDKLRLLNEAVLTGRCVLTDSVAVVFAGNPMPSVHRGEGFVDLTWTDKVELDLPGFVDPDIDYVRVWQDRAEVRFRIGGKAVIR